jgi:cytochrome c oxidase subunit 3
MRFYFGPNNNQKQMEIMSVADEQKEIRGKVAKPLLGIAIVSMVMFFGAFTSAYIVSRGKVSTWVVFDLPSAFYISTALILASSVTMNWATSLAKRGEFTKVKLPVLLTILLGVAFVFTQFMGYKELVANNIFWMGKYSHPSGSYLYMLVFMHFLHLFAGLIALFVVYYRSSRGRYNSGDILGIKLCAIFWHFLDVLWILLFLFLFFVR